MAENTKGKIAIIGSGIIGRSWSMLFVGGGYSVSLYDIKPELTHSALTLIKNDLVSYEEKGVLRGADKRNAEQQFNLIEPVENIEDCVRGALHLQECVFEDLEVKRKLFNQLDEIVDDNVVLSSSSSCILPSLISETMKHRSQVVVSHPVNPPYIVPVVEVVCAPWTSPDVVNRTRTLLTDIGQTPVVLNKEVPGFALNRIQFAILNECWRLVADGVMSVKDVDATMSSGLGLRYALLGPLETAHINAEGMQSYCERYGEGIKRVSKTFGETPSWTADDAADITKQLCEMVPLDKLQERCSERDQFLFNLMKLKSEFK